MDDVETLTRRRWDALWSSASEDTGLYQPDINLQLRDALRLIRESWPPPRAGRFLEAGCGLGATSLHLALEGADVTGVDLSPAAVEMARGALEGHGLEGTFVVGDVRELPFDERTFDFVYAGGVVEHFRSTVGAVAEMRRVVRPGGRVLLTVPALTFSYPYLALRGNIPCVPGVEEVVAFVQLRLLRGRLSAYGYERSFTKRKLRATMVAAGFVDPEMGCFDTYLPLEKLPGALRGVARRLARLAAFCPMYWALGER
jgi:SAM-dependent methyltransferase